MKRRLTRARKPAKGQWGILPHATAGWVGPGGPCRWYTDRVAPELTDIEPGTLLDDRYRVGSLLGRGGMAHVFEGLDERDQRSVAIKVLRRQFTGDKDFRRRFEREAQAAARIDHEGVVRI